MMDCVPCRQKGCNGKVHSRCLDSLDTDYIRHVIREAININWTKT